MEIYLWERYYEVKNYRVWGIAVPEMNFICNLLKRNGIWHASQMSEVDKARQEPFTLGNKIYASIYLLCIIL